MVYVPKLDRQGFADRQGINQERNRPTMSRKDAFLQGHSPAGKNYATMMDLMKQAERTGGFKSGDPRIDQLKDARRKYNRQDKYNIGEIMGQTPQFMNELYRTNSGVLREHANPTYKAMYPISDMLHRVTGSGGLTGLLLNEAFGKAKKSGRDFFKDLRTMGDDIMGAIGIGGAVDPEEATEEVLDNYATSTFGRPNMREVAGETEIDALAPYSPTHEDQIQALIDEEQRKVDNFETNAYSDILDDAIESHWGTQKEQDDYYDKNEQGEMVFADVPDEWAEPIPFDVGREDYIRRQNEYVSPPPVFPGNVRQDPQDTDAYLRWLTAPRLGSADPQGDFDSFNEYADNESGLEVTLPLPTQKPIPFDDSNREEGIAALYGHGPKEPVRSKDVEDYQRQMNKVMEKYGHDRRFTYDQAEEMWKRKHTLPRGLHEDERSIPSESLQFYAKYPELRGDNIPSDYPDQISRIR